MKKVLFMFVSIIISGQLGAATIARTGKVTDVKMFNSVFVIYVSEVDKACDGNHRRVAIKTDNPLFSAVVSSALTAKATGNIVEIGYKDSCTFNSLAWDFQHFWLKS